MTTSSESRRIAVNGVELNITVTGDGPALLLLHGWPHTGRLWSTVTPQLAENHLVIAPDLRGLGASSRPAVGYDAANIAADLLALLDALNVSQASVMAIDASVPAAFLLGMESATRLHRLVLMESLLVPLPGAEGFLAAGPPWWFGFHSAPGLAETVLEGHEEQYLDFFLRSGTFRGRGIPEPIRKAFVAAYTGSDALRAGFEYYRAAAASAAQVAAATAAARLTVPTMAIGGNTVGDALYRQLSGVAEDLVGHLIPECGHIVPLDAPEALLELVVPFLRATPKGG